MSKVKIKSNDLRKAVNDSDKELGLELGHESIYSYTSFMVDDLTDDFDNSVLKLIAKLNKIDNIYQSSDRYRNINLDGKMYRAKDTDSIDNSNAVKIDDSNFVEYSKLKWDTDRGFKTNSNIFNKRFYTLILLKLLGNSERIANNRRDLPHSEDEFKSIVINKYIKLIDSMTNIKSTDSKLQLLELLYYVKKKNTSYMNTLISTISTLKIGISKSLLIKNKLHDDVIIFTIIKLVLLLTTGSLKSLECIEFASIEHCTFEHNFDEFLEYIGSIISDNRYTAFENFIRCRPYVYKNAETKNMHNLYLGLEYAKFILSDYKYIIKYINKIEDNSESIL